MSAMHFTTDPEAAVPLAISRPKPQPAPSIWLRRELGLEAG